MATKPNLLIDSEDFASPPEDNFDPTQIQAPSILATGGDFGNIGMDLNPLAEEDPYKPDSLDWYNPVDVAGMGYLTIASAASGIYNTMAMVANKVGSDGIMKYTSTLDWARRADDLFQTGGALQSDYLQHQIGYEISGSIAGSIVPGLGGIKLLGMAGKGVKALAAAENANIITKAASVASGLTPTSLKTRALQSGYQAAMTGNSALTGVLSAQRAAFAGASMLGGAAEFMAFDAMATLTQLGNPTYKDINDIGDFSKHMLISGTLGGTFGGIGGAFFMKGKSFFPSAGAESANQSTTLRKAINMFGQAREAAFQTQDDLAKNLLSIPTGSKIVSLQDELLKSPEELKALITSKLKDVPADLMPGMEAQITAWADQAAVRNKSYLSDFLLDLTKGSGKDNTIGKSIEDFLTTSGIGQDMTRVGPIFQDLESVSKIPVGYHFGEPVANTTIGQVAKTLPENRTIPVKLGDKVVEVQTSDLAGNIQRAEAAIKAAPKPQNKFIFDLEAGQFITSAKELTLNIADFAANSSGLKFIGGKSGTAAIIADGQILVRDLSKVLYSKDFSSLSSIESQAAWTFASGTLEASIAPGKTPIYWETIKNSPFMLQAAVDSGKRIIKDSTTDISLREAQRELGRQKLSLLKASMGEEGKANIQEALRRANITLEMLDGFGGNNFEIFAEKAFDFTKRKNVQMSYVESLADIGAKNLKDTDLTALAEITSQVYTQREAVAAATQEGIMGALGLKIPAGVQTLLEGLRRDSIYAATPAEFADRANAGAAANFNAKIFTRNMTAKILGNFTKSNTDRLKDFINTSVSQEVRAINLNPNKAKIYEEIALIHKRVTGGGDKWAFADAAVKGPSDYLISRKAVEDIAKSRGEVTFEDFLDTPQVMQIKTAQVRNLLSKYSQVNGALRAAQTELATVRGANAAALIPGELYFPPINTSKSPFFLMVVDRSNSLVGNFDSVSFIHARNGIELEAKKNMLQKIEGLELFSKEDIAKHKKINGAFNWEESFSSYNVDSMLYSKQIFSDYVPRAGDEIVGEMLGHMNNQANLVSRGITKNLTGNFLENNAVLSDTIKSLDKSTHGGLNRGATPKGTDNFYDQLNRSVLNMGPSESSEGILGAWTSASRAATEVIDEAAGKLANVYRMWGRNNPMDPKILKEFDAYKKTAKTYGLDLDSITEELYRESVKHYTDPRAAAALQQALNRTATTFLLGLDMAYAIVNGLSLPITVSSSLREAMRNSPRPVSEEIQRFANPGTMSLAAARISKEFLENLGNIHRIEVAAQKGSVSKALESAAINPSDKLYAFANSSTGKFYKEMLDTGLINPTQRQMLVEFGEAMNIGSFNQSNIFNKLSKVTQIATTPARYSELFTRWMGLRMGGLIAERTQVAAAERLGFLTQFSELSAGLMTSTQRAGIFQGPIGGSFGLYKSYALNLMQVLGRHIEAGDKRALIEYAGLQGTIFGSNSVPGSKQISDYIFAQNRSDSRDLEQTMHDVFSKPVADTVLYGVASNVLSMGLYSRGDMNPRSVLGPFSDLLSPNGYPAISQIGSVGSAFMQAGSAMMNGANAKDAVLMGLAHQGLSRPIARLSEYGLGWKTTKSGALVDDLNASSNSVVANIFIRAAGAKPLDQAIRDDWIYRQRQHKQDNSQLIGEMKKALQLSTATGEGISNDAFEKFVERYRKAGGSPQNFRAAATAIRNAAKNADGRRFANTIRRSPAARALQQLDQPSRYDYFQEADSSGDFTSSSGLE